MTFNIHITTLIQQVSKRLQIASKNRSMQCSVLELILPVEELNHELHTLKIFLKRCGQVVSSDNCIKCSFAVTLQILIKMHNESVLLAHSFTHSLIHSPCLRFQPHHGSYPNPNCPYQYYSLQTMTLSECDTRGESRVVELDSFREQLVNVISANK
jgi:hypothetical protein